MKKTEKALPLNDWMMPFLPSNGLKMIDLFCGAGIGATGFKRAGFDIVYAVDNQQYAVDTYNQNIGEHAVVSDIRTINGVDLPYADVVTGGFPCKSYSTIGKGKGVEDEKNGDLAAHFVRLIDEIKPKAFLMENVGGLLTKKHRAVFDAILFDLSNLGYEVSWSYLDCSNFGVPQKRKRIFAIGILKTMNRIFEFPKEEANIKTSIREAIGDLPEPSDEGNTIRNHYGYGIRKDELPFVEKIPPGGNWKNLEEQDQKKFLGKAYYSGGGRTGFLRKVSFENPAWTLTSMMNGKNNAQIVDLSDKYRGEKHGNRRFTVRECLRLQTVPDSFFFSDSLSLAKQYERCSGIPSLVAYQLGKALNEQLKSSNILEHQIF